MSPNTNVRKVTGLLGSDEGSRLASIGALYDRGRPVDGDATWLCMSMRTSTTVLVRPTLCAIEDAATPVASLERDESVEATPPYILGSACSL